MILPQAQALEVISSARTYTQSGSFGAPFIKATFVNMDPTAQAALDISGEVPLLPKIPITLDCGTGGVNTSNIQINLNQSTTGVVVYWTQYSGFEWKG